MRESRKHFSLVAISLVVALLLCTGAFAQTADDSPIKINLTVSKTSFAPGEPIGFQIRAYNVPGDAAPDVITREGFFGQDFRTQITFYDPDGLLIRNRFKVATNEPGPATQFMEKEAAVVEIVPPIPAGERNLVLNDAREYYDLIKYGWYTAEVLVPMETFSTYYQNENGVLYAFMDDPGRRSYNPLASNRVRFEIVKPQVPTSPINVKVSLLKIGTGTTPKTTKTPLGGVEVRLVQQSKIPSDYYPLNYKTYPMIWAYLQGGNLREGVEQFTQYTSSQDGIARFDFPAPRDNYLVLAQYNQSPDFKHMGSPIPADDPGWTTPPIERNLMVIEKENGKKVPGKTTKLKGSELLITEPEFMVWDSSTEKYPFVFESVGDWGVTTAVTPPQGFVADYKTLTTQVTNELETLQFTITDKGSKWVETVVTYKIKHKGMTQTIKSMIGIKLSTALAKAKGLGVYGNTPEPGPFKGGKKVTAEAQK